MRKCRRQGEGVRQGRALRQTGQRNAGTAIYFHYCRSSIYLVFPTVANGRRRRRSRRKEEEKTRKIVEVKVAMRGRGGERSLK